MSFPCKFGSDCNGCGRCQEEESVLHCPICGAELMDIDILYTTSDNEIFGCENCVHTVKASKAAALGRSTI